MVLDQCLSWNHYQSPQWGLPTCFSCPPYVWINSKTDLLWLKSWMDRHSKFEFNYEWWFLRFNLILNLLQNLNNFIIYPRGKRERKVGAGGSLALLLNALNACTFLTKWFHLFFFKHPNIYNSSAPPSPNCTILICFVQPHFYQVRGLFTHVYKLLRPKYFYLCWVTWFC